MMRKKTRRRKRMMNNFMAQNTMEWGLEND